MTKLLETPMSRRNVLQAATAGALTIAPALRAAVYAQGSDKPEKEEVKIGFIPLTDCASVVMASVLGIDKKYGVKIIPTKESSWAKTQTSWESVKKSCQLDIKKHCKDLDQENLEKMKAVQVCLMSEGKNLQDGCKKDLNRHIRDHQPNIKEIP